METESQGSQELLWECVFCSKNFQNILQLPCQHTFCEPCLRSWINIYLCFDDYGGLIDRFPCRVCWKIFQVPPAGIGALRQHHPVDQLQQLLNQMSMHDPAAPGVGPLGLGPPGVGPPGVGPPGGESQAGVNTTQTVGQEQPMDSNVQGGEQPAVQGATTVVDECFHCGMQHYHPVPTSSNLNFHV